MKQVKMLPNDDLNPLFLATVQAVEESVVNALIAAKTMKGINDFEVDALPHAELQQVLRRYNRLVEPAQK
jgi:L-aminopeptidase/D-esterase-like protein